MPSKRLSAEERKSSIMATATPLFACRGVNGVTTRQIADACKISEALLYKHFPSKEAIFAEIEISISEVDSVVVGAPEGMEPGTQALTVLTYLKIRRTVYGKMDDSFHDDLPRFLLQSLLSGSVAVRAIFDRTTKPFNSYVDECLKHAAEAGDLEDCRISANDYQQFIFSICGSYLLSEIPDEPIMDYGVTGEELVDKLTRFCLKGLGVTVEAIDKFLDKDKINEFVKK